ncbi:MAG: FAD-dependent oxidoreductase [Acidobacteriota bacterium]
MTTLILGGGLSGLHTAYSLSRRGHDVFVLEGRDRLGGRIQSSPVTGPARAGDVDLGPAWFWPGQRRMHGLIHELGLADDVVNQYARGDELVERGPGQVLRGRFGVSMGGSYRLRGGMASLIRALAGTLQESQVRLGRRATRIARTEAGVAVTVQGPDGVETYEGDQAVVALPPRLAASTLELDPALGPKRSAELAGQPTWMAGQGKCVAIYDEPFWRRDGLSGDAVSYIGPLGEIHDVTPNDDGPGALFGFYALPAMSRRAAGPRLEPACVEQLVRLFGAAAETPRQILSRDWAFEDLTAVDADRSGPATHALHGLRSPKEPAWGGRLLWSGAETAGVGERNNGYLEGALEASERTVEFILGPASTS